MKSVFGVHSAFSFKKQTDIVKKKIIISVKSFKNFISKSFMPPCFLLLTLYVI